MQNQVSVVFFDIGGTLGVVELDAHGTPKSFEPYAHIPRLLQELTARGLRLGIISDTGDHPGSVVAAALTRSTIWENLDKDLLIFSADVGLRKDSARIFSHASQVAKASPSKCLFVGEDSWERLHAAAAGMKVSPHPLLVADILRGEQVRFVQVSAPDGLPASHLRQVLQGRSFVPLQASGRDRSKVIGIATTSTLAALANAQLDVQALGAFDTPLFSDLYLLRDDRAARTGFLSFEGQSGAFFATGEEANWLLSSSSEGLLVAVAAGRSVEEFHFQEAHHGHNLKLTPDPTLLTAFEGVLAATAFVEGAQRISDALTEPERQVLASLTDATIERHIAPYIGKKDLGDGGPPIRSRHIDSADNQRVVDALSRHFLSISDRLRVRLHPFMHEGRRLFNVEAELGETAASEIVLVTAHLDSTAAFSPPYDPRTDEAPGVDDDASGVAAVLAIAASIAVLASQQPMTRAVRFVLFNAEEHGLVGSKAYARDQAAKAAPIVAVLQMDMIGYNVEPPRSWELHAGYWPSSQVQARSLALVEQISRMTSRVSPELEAPQLYVSRGPLPADRDPAEGRSDHAAFQERGYPACAASEDFFAGPDPQAPQPEGNPHYHQKQDTFVDARFAADIARVIAAVAWTMARTPMP